MKTVDQVAHGIASFYDMEIRPSLAGWKGIAYGVAIGRIASGLPRLVEQYAPVLSPLGILVEGKIDAEGLATELRKQMERSDGKLTVQLMGDSFTFTASDVDALMRHIERA